MGAVSTEAELMGAVSTRGKKDMAEQRRARRDRARLRGMAASVEEGVAIAALNRRIEELSNEVRQLKEALWSEQIRANSALGRNDRMLGVIELLAREVTK